MQTLVLATANAHKVQEIRAILGDGFQYRTLRDFPAAPAAIEDGLMFAENARKKAAGLARWISETRALPAGGFAVLGDDSGLEVDALRGAPGVHSARFAALDQGRPGNSPDADNNTKLLRLMAGIPPERRTARFRCALAWIEPASGRGATALEAEFDGACNGRLALTAAGAGGFGYDPLFVPDGFTSSFAELGDEVKNRISHRSQALAALRQWLDQRSERTSAASVSP